MSNFFKNISQIKYEGKNSDNLLSFKYYNEDQIDEKKYRMTQKRFEAELLNRVDIVLAGVINNFPEPGELFINQ